ncbi:MULTISPECIES: hypothetical protein [Halobacteriales]|uniref:Uncharacterized protein n=2 Tax=Halobacteriales TaxID=2235 RepID=A0A1I0R0M4_9EURY|nr:hypothetical protein [Natrinema salifodinae]SEW33028.1 hypothetical protein SAMN05216285_4190 [Natrinema salifodinae]
MEDEYTIGDRDVSMDWCHRCGEPLEEHAEATIDGEVHRICPVEERAVDEENPQEQLTAFGGEANR